MLSIEGTIGDIIYKNDDTGYTVCEIATVDGDVTVVGHLPFVSEGDSIKVTGEWAIHLEYGEQFKAAYFERKLPESRQEILVYLSSGIIKGVGAATAKRIVDMFGEQALDIIRTRPQELSAIKGIKLEKALSIHTDFIKKEGIQNIVVFFQKHGISPVYAIRVYKELGETAVEQVTANPYLLCHKVEGFGFKTADKIAYALGLGQFSLERAKAGIIYMLTDAVNDGHCCLPRHELMDKTSQLLEATSAEVDNVISTLMLEGGLVCRQSDGISYMYLIPFHIAECGIASRIMSLSSEGHIADSDALDDDICSIEKTIGINLDGKQREAVRLAMTSGLLVITGGPGTGKTTIVNTIIRLFEKRRFKIALAAPTGRAAKRLSEICMREAKTIHRLLEMTFKGENGGRHYGRDEQNPLDIQALIVDEVSMVDTILMYRLLKALPQGARLILVGDSDQLPSVGAGDVLGDIIKSNIVKTVRLTEIFRQAQESMIIVNAHRINKGDYPIFSGKESDFFMMERNNTDKAIEDIVDLCANRLPSYLGVDALTGVQVLTPARKGVAGVENLNFMLQKVLNPKDLHKKEYKKGRILLREGDKIMQTKNNYDLEWDRVEGGNEGTGVFNGDIGIISKIDHEIGFMSIVFDGERQVEYPFDLVDDLVLAYAITVHKSQGSEFPAVVMPMFPSAPMLMYRNLLYTAVTRARRLAVLVGREDIVKYMTDNNRESERYSGLCELLQAEV